MSLDELLHTLEVCRRALPGDAHPAHHANLDQIAAIVRRAFAGSPAPGGQQGHDQAEGTKRP